MSSGSIRIIQLPEKSSVNTDDYMAVDSSANGTKKVKFTDLLDSNLSAQNKAADAQATGEAISGLNTDINTEKLARQSTDNSLQAQIDQLVAPSGTAPNPAEIENARIGADGVTYDTLGNAIRTQFSNVKSDFNDVAKVDTDYWNLLDAKNYQVKEKTFITGGSEVANNGYYTYMYIEVEPNTLYRFYDSAYGAGQARFVNTYKADKTFIQTYGEPFNITTSADCKYICVTFKYADDDTQTRGNTWISKFDSPDHFNVPNTEAPNTLKIPSECVDKGINLDNAEHRIATFNFQFDDGVEQDVTVYEAFKAKGLTCGFALLSTNTRDRQYLSYQADGFEILSHSTDSDPMETDSQADSVIEGKLKDSKKALTAKGYNIRGWVTPNSAMNSRYIPLLRKYYDYGMTVYYNDHPTYPVYQNETADTCKLYRIGLGTSYDSMKAVVDDAIANNGFVTFYGHSWDIGTGISLSAMNQLLDYLNTKIADLQCYVLNPSDAVDYYFHPRHIDESKSDWRDLSTSEFSLNSAFTMTGKVSINEKDKICSVCANFRATEVVPSGTVVLAYNMPYVSGVALRATNDIGKDVIIYDNRQMFFSNSSAMAVGDSITIDVMYRYGNFN